MAKRALITLKDLKRKSIIDGNLDGDKIMQYIEVAQDTYIQPRVGTKLYEKLMNLIDLNTIGDSANVHYKTLLDDHVAPMLIWYAQATYMDFAPYKAANGGVFKHRSENSDTATESELAHMKAKMIEYAEFYVKRYEDWMDYNKFDFDEYDKNQDDDMRPDSNINFSNWVL
tara:strand:- start:147 stop:659 length:513 start_codon:yes stop_codon:yes gene_type:complete